MPDTHAQFSTQAIRQRPETSRQHRSDIVGLELQVVNAFFVPVDGGAKCVGRSKAIDRLRDVDSDRSGRSMLSERHIRQKSERDDQVNLECGGSTPLWIRHRELVKSKAPSRPAHSKFYAHLSPLELR